MGSLTVLFLSGPTQGGLLPPAESG